MCGITGIFARPAARIRRQELSAAVASLHHRGPDDRGFFVDGNLALGHARLSIRDLSEAGHQPMISPCGRYVLVYNGELYNAAEIAEELKSQGVEFKGHSDSEVLLHALIRNGEGLLPKLNGMFAFAFWDRELKELLCARDRFGIKPFYYALPAENGALGRDEQLHQFLFGSEIKALFAAFPRLQKRLKKDALPEFLYYGTSLGAHTLFTGIFRLLPGHFMRIRANLKPQISSYTEGLLAPEKSIFYDVGKRRKKVRALLEEAVERHLVSDVPVSVFLSGGIDSSAITAFASRSLGKSLSTYAVGFDIPGGVDELPYAKKVADYFGVTHHEMHVKMEQASEVLEALNQAHDLPFSDAANIPLFLLCKNLPDNEKVVLQGDGGDEIFAGYRRYGLLFHQKALRKAAQAAGSFIPLLQKLGPKGAKNWERISRMREAFSSSDEELLALLMTEETRSLSPLRILSTSMQNEVVDENAFARYFELATQDASKTLAQKMLHIDTQVILPDVFLEKVDRSTMAHSIEVRVPFLDVPLTDYVRSLPISSKMGMGHKKQLLKNALRGVVPDEVLDRKKTGFGVPYGDWLKGTLGDMLLDLQRSKQVAEAGLFNADKVESLLKEHRAGLGRHSFLLYKALTLSLWMHRFEVEL